MSGSTGTSRATARSRRARGGREGALQRAVFWLIGRVRAIRSVFAPTCVPRAPIVNQAGVETACSSAGRRSFAHLTEWDRELLAALDRISPELGDEFEAELREQWRSDRRFYRHHHKLDEDLGELRGMSLARRTHGAGGGRRRPTRPTDA